MVLDSVFWERGRGRMAGARPAEMGFRIELSVLHRFLGGSSRPRFSARHRPKTAEEIFYLAQWLRATRTQTM
jgi:hypothetical protein